MKRKLLLAVIVAIISYCFLILNTSAKVLYNQRYIYSNLTASEVSTSGPSNSSLKNVDGHLVQSAIYNSVDWSISHTITWTLQNPVSLTANVTDVFAGYLSFFDQSLANCQVGQDGYCNQYSIYSTANITLKMNIRSSTSNKQTSCEMNFQNGFWTASCPLPQDMSDFDTIIWNFASTSYKLDDNSSFSFGLSYTFVEVVNSDVSEVTSAISDSSSQIIESQNENTQKEISAMNQNSQNEVNATNQNTEAINNMNDTISNSDSSGASSDAESFFSGFDNDTHGLTSIITAPLQLIGSITSSTCSPIGIPIPFVDTTAYLPCMSEIYNQWFGDFFKLYQTITFGMISYWVCVQIFAMVKGFKDPDSDRIEVLDL